MNADKSIMLAQANSLTTSKQPFTKIEKRCLYCVIEEVRRLYVDKDLREDDKPYQDLFSDMYITLTHEKLQQLGDEVKDVYNSLKKLKDKTIEIDNDEMWLITSWILQAKHIKKNNTYEVLVSKEILPYLVELASQFTAYNLVVAIVLQSIYSQRLYELCCMYRNKGRFFLSIEDLKEILNISHLKTYDNTANIKRKILEVAQKELQTLFEEGQSDIYFTYRVKDSKGKKILSFWFDLHTKETEEQKRIEFATTQTQIRRILEICRAFIKNDEKYIKRIENALNYNPSIVQEVLEKMHKKLNNYSKKEIAPILRYILQEDYGIK